MMQAVKAVGDGAVGQFVAEVVNLLPEPVACGDSPVAVMGEGASPLPAARLRVDHRPAEQALPKRLHVGSPPGISSR